ncbi:MAG: tRNA (adenosine(37)-N6)-dimethylallyltransferase MiaA [Synechococcales cyanobacterium RM1_1_8]|nr:tRNA (adenosine(37)-N6)-dimethylallyltransferase MiaA [Synechococcales cyanobacterium RM1_1_8]
MTVAKTQALIVICGPTAAGKSGLALALAQRFGSVILSADSRQVYRGFDIGTAKPSPQEQAQVPHGLIDLCDPRETLTLGDYQQRARVLIEQYQAAGQVQYQVQARHQGESADSAQPQSQPPGPAQGERPAIACPLLVGGTGLYIKSITRGLRIPRVPPQAELRSQLARLGQTHNYSLLGAVDRTAQARIHPNDALRTQRALEVFYATGQPISAQQGEEPPDYPILQIGIDTGMDTGMDTGNALKTGDAAGEDRLRQRIAQRTDQMVAAGFVEEVAGLVQRYGDSLPLLSTLGYAEMRQHLRGEIDLTEAKRLTVLHSRQFAKRQRTWFRALPEIEWFDADAEDLVDRVGARVEAFWGAIA